VFGAFLGHEMKVMVTGAGKLGVDEREIFILEDRNRVP